MPNRLKVSLGVTGGAMIGLSAALIAGPVNLPNTFTAGTQAKAAEINANFAAVKTAVDDNASHIANIETIAPRTGNLVLEGSTATSGNLLKGSTPFLHNFGEHNVFLGVEAGNFTMTAGASVGVGTRALAANGDGYSATALGYQAMKSNTHGKSNTAVGSNALSANTVGQGNTAVGGSSMSQSNGSSNVAVGISALSDNTTGNSNIALGSGAGSSLTTGSNNIAIGHVGAAGESGTIRIGTTGTQTRAFVAGIRGVTITSGAVILIDSTGQMGTINSSRSVKDHIEDMATASDRLKKLRPVTFYYKADQNKQRTIQYGLVAEEVAEIAPELVARNASGEIESVYYQFLAPMLLNEFQKQQRLIESQSARLDAQAREIEELKREQTTRPSKNR